MLINQVKSQKAEAKKSRQKPKVKSQKIKAKIKAEAKSQKPKNQVKKSRQKPKNQVKSQKPEAKKSSKKPKVICSQIVNLNARCQKILNFFYVSCSNSNRKTTNFYILHFWAFTFVFRLDFPASGFWLLDFDLVSRPSPHAALLH